MSRAATSTYLPGATRLPQGGIKGRIDSLFSKLGNSRFIKPILDKAIKKQQQALTAQADEIARAANESKVKADSKEKNTSTEANAFAIVSDDKLQVKCNNDANDLLDLENLNDLTLGGDNAAPSRPKLNRDTLDQNINSTKDFEDSPAPTSTSRI